MKVPKIPYWPLLFGPSLLFGLGFLLNAFVVGINKGQMPVHWLGPCLSDTMQDDPIHACMTYGTHLKFLADWIVINGRSIQIASPGDFLEMVYDLLAVPFLCIWIALMIRDHQERPSIQERWPHD